MVSDTEIELGKASVFVILQFLSDLNYNLHHHPIGDKLRTKVV